LQIGRRDFLKLATLLLFSFISKPNLGLEKTNSDSIVSLSRFYDLSRDVIHSAAVSCIDNLPGGIPGFERMVKDRKVVIKPNCVSATPKILGKTTHPDLIRTLCTLSLMHGAKEVIVAEGSVEADTLTAFQVCGITSAVSDLEYVKLVDLNKDSSHPTEVRNPIALPTVDVPDTLKDAVLISAPTLKSHILARVSLGLKNLVGSLPANIYSQYWPMRRNRNMFHDLSYSGWKKLHQDTDPYDGKEHSLDTQGAIADIASVITIDLTVVDGTVGLEGGWAPTDGAPVDLKERTGSYLLVASYDPVAADYISARIMGWSDDEIKGRKRTPAIWQFKYAAMKSLGTWNSEAIEVVGANVESINAHFKRAYYMQWHLEKLIVEISTDKWIYSPGDDMKITVRLANPHPNSQNAKLTCSVQPSRADLSQILVQVPVYLGAGFDREQQFTKVVGNFGGTAFRASVQASISNPATGEIICKDQAHWWYVPENRKEGTSHVSNHSDYNIDGHNLHNHDIEAGSINTFI